MDISRGQSLEFPNLDVLHSLNIVFILANSADPDEMSRSVAFYLNLYCLPKYMLRGSQYTLEIDYAYVTAVLLLMITKAMKYWPHLVCFPTYCFFIVS